MATLSWAAKNSLRGTVINPQTNKQNANRMVNVIINNSAPFFKNLTN
jgi:hypothetical protein